MNNINLVPLVGKLHVYNIRKLGFVFAILVFSFTLLGVGMRIFGLNDAARYPFFAATLFFCVAVFLLYYGLRYSKISQSSVDFLSMCIQIKDERGNIWREIPYEAISDIRKERIAGFFIMQYPEDFIAEYICIYLHECNYAPDGSHYSKLFHMPDFFPIAFNQDAYEYLSRRVELRQAAEMYWDADN